MPTSPTRPERSKAPSAVSFYLLLILIALVFTSCGGAHPPDISADVARIRAIDNHAHPVTVDPLDRGFDALPVDNMEPASDPLALRPGAPGVLEAWKALYGYNFDDLKPEHANELKAKKQRRMDEKGEGYPAWVLDQAGVDTMLANRVEMGRGVQPPRFRWVAYADALIFPLDNSDLAAKNPDRKAFFTLEDVLRQRYLKEAGMASLPSDLAGYLTKVVTPTLERHRQGGALGEKFEAAYLRTLEFDKVDRTAAEKVYSQFHGRTSVPGDQYKTLQDFLFRYVASECGRLGMAVHIHTMAGAGSYFDVSGANPLNLESVLNDPDLRKTKFVMVHGGWPFIREITPLLEKPNAYLDISGQTLQLTPAMLARNLRSWLEWVPEKVLFGTDAYPYSEELGWEVSTWIATRRGRQALTIALTAMMRDGEISRERALELANMVLRDNARKLYGF
ncbi:MAG: amidohydrolase family protein [Bryobacteraceae bacterium]